MRFVISLICMYLRGYREWKGARCPVMLRPPGIPVHGGLRYMLTEESGRMLIFTGLSF